MGLVFSFPFSFLFKSPVFAALLIKRTGNQQAQSLAGKGRAVSAGEELPPNGWSRIKRAVEWAGCVAARKMLFHALCLLSVVATS